MVCVINFIVFDSNQIILIMRFTVVYVQSFLLICVFYVTTSDHTIDDGYRELCHTDKYRCDCPQGVNSSANVVDCSNRGLTDMSQYISFKDGIERVVFKYNRIVSVLENTFMLGRDLKILDLSYNEIDFMQHSVFTLLENLEKLILSHNSIWSLDVNLLDGLHALSTLDLSYNRIMAWDQQLFAPCKNLKILDLSYNWIGSSGLAFGAFERLPRLEKLNLENTGLTSLPPYLFSANYKLKALYLKGNPMKSVPNTALQSAPSLSLLDMSATNLEVIEYEDFAGLKSLTELRLERIATLRKIGINAFGDLSRLESFVCRHNYRLIQIDSKAFTNNLTGVIWSLVNLDVRHNSLQTVNEEMLLWKSLRVIDLSGNPFRCDCNIKWMAEFDLKDQLKQTKCSQPKPLSGRLIKSLSASDLVCQSLTIGDSFLVMITSFILLATITLTFTAFLFIRRKWCANGCYVPFRRRRINYLNVIANKDRVDLEWDDSTEPRFELN